MPYIVTTHRPGKYERPIEDGDRYSHTAVATLDEAREKAGAVYGAGPTFIAEKISESGGTIGPLPDGTVVEVRRIGWADLARQAEPIEARHVEGAWPREHLRSHRRTVLAAFNGDD